MPFIPVPNVAQAEIRGLLNSEEVENVLHFQFNGSQTQADLMELGDGLWTWYDTYIKPLVGGLMSVREIYLTDLTSQTGPTFSYTQPFPINGTATGDTLPNNCALSVTKRTAKRGRSYRGRIFHMGLVESQVSASYVLSSFGPTIASAYAQLAGADTIYAGYTFCVVSRYANKQPRTVGIATPVTGTVITNLAIDSQRRRLP